VQKLLCIGTAENVGEIDPLAIFIFSLFDATKTATNQTGCFPAFTTVALVS